MQTTMGYLPLFSGHFRATLKSPMKLPLAEEITNSITHGIGFIGAVIGLILFFIFQQKTSDIWRIVGFSIFGGTLIFMYFMSTLSHSLIFTKARKVFAVLDHSSIFLLIAGTYTYFLLTTLRGTTGWTLLTIIWGLSITGIILKAFFVDRLHLLSVGIYLGMGWLIVFFIKPLLHILHPNIFILLLTGGILYSVGTFFYSSKKIPFAHSIWHVFVVLATACHFLAIYLL